MILILYWVLWRGLGRRGRGGGGAGEACSEGWGEGRGPVVRAVVRVDNGSEKVIYITR